MNKKQKIGLTIFLAVTVLFVGVVIAGEYIGNAEKTEAVKDFKASPQPGNIVEIEQPKNR